MFSAWNIYDFVRDEYAQFLSWDSDSLTDLPAPCLFFFYCTSMNERVEHRKLNINYYSETKNIEDFKYFAFEY